MIRAAVLGQPIQHSLSPLVHGLIYKELGLDYIYEKVELSQDEARQFLLARLSDWSGFSLTMPLKEVGFTLGLPVAESAIQSHSINTITREGCFNTDISGFLRVMVEEESEWKEVFLLGSGATARSALIALDSYFSKTRITLFRRGHTRDALLPQATRNSLHLKSLTEWSAVLLPAKSLVISTLPSTAQSAVSASLAGFEGTLIDFSYSPWPSTLAGVVGGPVISGLPILVSQAVDQAILFTGRSFDATEMYRKVLLSTVRTLASEG